MLLYHNEFKFSILNLNDFKTNGENFKIIKRIIQDEILRDIPTTELNNT